jgi:peptidoglycan DL-endopeptidase CwlO
MGKTSLLIRTASTLLPGCGKGKYGRAATHGAAVCPDGAVTMVDQRRTARFLARTMLSTVIGGALALGVLAPAHAQPTDVPDTGARPAPAGEVPLPDGSRMPAIPDGMEGPLAGEIAEVESQIAALVTRLREVEPQRVDATDVRVRAQAEWEAAEQARADAEQALAELVEEAYRSAAAVLPHLTGATLRDLAAHAPVPVDAPLGVEAAGRKLLRAEQVAERADRGYAAALEVELALDGRIRGYESELAGLQAELEDLRDRNAAALVEQEAAEQRRAAEGSFPLQDTVAGLQAHERALEAVQFALRQLGKPYLWGAQGPDRYDCSGLMWDAYRSVGVSLPRVAADQYFGTRTRPVARHALLPGDLVFFSSSATDWRQIHHVGMYVGDGRMVHAPNRNTVVKVSPVWWSRFFAATRVVGAIPVDDTDPSPSPSPSPTPSPTPPPSSPPPSSPSPTPPPSDSPSTVTVPDLRTGMSADEAEQAITDAGLTPVKGDPVTEGCTTPGEVVAQEPAAGEEVTQGSAVTYHLCEPAVPELTGLPEQEALAALQALIAMGFDVAVETTYELSEEHDPGTVLGVEPPAGTPIAHVDTITLRVVGVEIPDVREQTVDEALALLGDLDGIGEITLEDPSGNPIERDDEDDRQVVDQRPEPGVHRYGTALTLLVAV